MESHELLDPDLVPVIGMDVDGSVVCYVVEEKDAHMAANLVAAANEVGSHEHSEVCGVLCWYETIKVGEIILGEEDYTGGFFLPTVSCSMGGTFTVFTLVGPSGCAFGWMTAEWRITMTTGKVSGR